jgi:hypothetical protein
MIDILTIMKCMVNEHINGIMEKILLVESENIDVS